MPEILIIGSEVPNLLEPGAASTLVVSLDLDIGVPVHRHAADVARVSRKDPPLLRRVQRLAASCKCSTSIILSRNATVWPAHLSSMNAVLISGVTGSSGTRARRIRTSRPDRLSPASVEWDRADNTCGCD